MHAHIISSVGISEGEPSFRYIRWFDRITARDVARVGGKNASLGEMIQTLKEYDVAVPFGFATTAEAYWHFVEVNGLRPKLIAILDRFHQQQATLSQTGKAVRRLFFTSVFPEDLAEEIRHAYRLLSQCYGQAEVDVAARSSATAEDLPTASFAGQQESFLNITGEAEVIKACQNCFTSLFTDRAISYREKNGFDHLRVALSVGIQKMVRSDKAGAGVMFSIDTESGFPDVVLINAAWGLGESIVQGSVIPDEYRVFKPLLQDSSRVPIIEKTLGSKTHKIVYAEDGSASTQTIATPEQEQRLVVLTDAEILQLARWAAIIESHYGTPVDMEWAKDGDTGHMFIVQARPETVHSQRQADTLRTYRLSESGIPLITGLSVGDAIAAGEVCLIEDSQDIERFREGGILVTRITEPDWVPVMRRAAAIVTDTGGRTSHAAIVSREYGIPAVVGTGQATTLLKDGQLITVSCAEGDTGVIYEGRLPYQAIEVRLDDIPTTRTPLMMNIANPAAAFHWWRLPAQGVGLARIEFIIGNLIKIHPMALIRFSDLTDRKARRAIEALTAGYVHKTEYFVDRLSRGIAKIAASRYPHPVVVRTSDFKTNEYASLIGGKQFEPEEANPMLGFRGASRYYREAYREGFALECQAILRAREQMGFTNIIVMIPFCRTLEEADKVLAELGKNGLKRGKEGLQVYMMSEIPSNVILAREFARRFDGFSIGSNDLTQLTLGIDRDSSDLAFLFDERNDAVKRMITQLIQEAHAVGIPVGICGQAPSDYPDFTAFLVNAGIDSISLNPDSLLSVRQHLAQLELSTSK